MKANHRLGDIEPSKTRPSASSQEADQLKTLIPVVTIMVEIKKYFIYYLVSQYASKATNLLMDWNAALFARAVMVGLSRMVSFTSSSLRKDFPPRVSILASAISSRQKPMGDTVNIWFAQVILIWEKPSLTWGGNLKMILSINFSSSLNIRFLSKKLTTSVTDLPRRSKSLPSSSGNIFCITLFQLMGLVTMLKRLEEQLARAMVEEASRWKATISTSSLGSSQMDILTSCQHQSLGKTENKR